MTVRPNSALLRFRSVLEQSKSAVMDKDDRDFVNDLGAVLHWLDFAEQALSTRDQLLTECAELFRQYEAHHRAKDEPGRLLKAERNGAIADRIEKLLGLVVEAGGCAPDIVVGSIQ